MVFNRRLTQEERDALTFEQFLDYMAWLASLEDSADSDESEREINSMNNRYSSAYESDR